MRRVLGIGWFPAEEWSLALERWPELAEEMPRDPVAYRATIESKVRELSARSNGAAFVLSPLRVAQLDERAAVEGGDAGSAELRGRLASEMAGRGEGVLWPPGRNDACWCRSARKYKRCCAVLAAPPGAPGAADQV